MPEHSSKLPPAGQVGGGLAFLGLGLDRVYSIAQTA
jgi:hypothetical protein